VPRAEARPRLLVLGGTAEARDLAARVVDAGDFEVVTSLAGRTRRPAAVAGAVRTGGFGGAEGLAAYLERAGIDLVVDATHPFAADISAHAVEACAAAGVPRLVLARPPWPRRPGDRWIAATDAAGAAAALPGLARRAFLALGRRGLTAFEKVRDIHFVVRLVEPPSVPLGLADCELVLGRGPFSLADERRLFARHRIEAVVSRQSGGGAAYAKIEAAREAGLPVVMIERPPPPPGPTAASVDEALAWLAAGPEQMSVSGRVEP